MGVVSGHQSKKYSKRPHSQTAQSSSFATTDTDVIIIEGSDDQEEPSRSSVVRRPAGNFAARKRHGAFRTSGTDGRASKQDLYNSAVINLNGGEALGRGTKQQAPVDTEERCPADSDRGGSKRKAQDVAKAHPGEGPGRATKRRAYDNTADFARWQTSSHEYVPLRRKWVKLDVPGDVPRARKAFSFTACTYNLLSQTLLERYRHQLYSHIQERWMFKWDSRCDALLDELKMYDADIITLQELDEKHWWNDFEPVLYRRGYDGYYVQCTGDSRDDGVAIFVRESKFKVVASLKVRHQQNTFLDRHNVGLIVLVQSREDPSIHMCVATTHLLFNTKRSFIKLAQFKWLADNAAHLIRTHLGSPGSTDTDLLDVPVLIAGDFNAEPNSLIVQRFVKNGFVDVTDGNETTMSGQIRGPVWAGGRPVPSQEEPVWQKGADRLRTAASSPTPLESEPKSTLTHPFHLRCAYQAHHDRPREYVTTRHGEGVGAVDYLLVGGFKERLGEKRRVEVRAVEYVEPPKAAEIGEMPNKYAASDHIPLVAEFSVVVRES
ncbi:hypothetical protein M427DRAFT_154608 [Gonapodya prolifera JEL478]|uniref:Endonuclease/exonuclease/phosphatase domain-containing protein n=1 Tax=Gonapodya prolifera (strain JEL478) TaxID=1344416 RepID=A0A139AIN2_GONPJ|nr:hypothetical protein M427DRAFT_154608 [Gonapodya prolifera JEL478]|eukprot:KXS16265.1 hypothetical protein M427DRAFT_154608 [Gonapodya prolifera JEL478]